MDNKQLKKFHRNALIVPPNIPGQSDLQAKKRLINTNKQIYRPTYDYSTTNQGSINCSAAPNALTNPDHPYVLQSKLLLGMNPSNPAGYHSPLNHPRECTSLKCRFPESKK